MQEDVPRARSQTRQRLVTLTVQPIQEAALDVLVVVLSLRSKSNTENISAIKTAMEQLPADALTRGLRVCRRTEEATLMADLTALILTVECGTMLHLSARGGGI